MRQNVESETCIGREGSLRPSQCQLQSYPLPWESKLSCKLRAAGAAKPCTAVCAAFYLTRQRVPSPPLAIGLLCAHGHRVSMPSVQCTSVLDLRQRTGRADTPEHSLCDIVKQQLSDLSKIRRAHPCNDDRYMSPESIRYPSERLCCNLMHLP